MVARKFHSKNNPFGGFQPFLSFAGANVLPMSSPKGGGFVKKPTLTVSATDPWPQDAQSAGSLGTFFAYLFLEGENFGGETRWKPWTVASLKKLMFSWNVMFFFEKCCIFPWMKLLWICLTYEYPLGGYYKLGLILFTWYLKARSQCIQSIF